MNIGERIAQLRKSRSMSQFQLAKTLNIATSTLGMYETNKRKPNMEMLEKLADFFGVSVDFLLGRPEKDDLNTADLADDDTIFTFEGKPIPEQDLEYMKRLLRGGRK
ncbi:helix-turn-helix domain-containing protein [Limosilactobacillus fermentum]|jgi:transcriptional regulator with XRE-family HTH domain